MGHSRLSQAVNFQPYPNSGGSVTIVADTNGQFSIGSGNEKCVMVDLYATADVYVRIGTDQLGDETATTDDYFLPANTLQRFSRREGQNINILGPSGSGGGVLYVNGLQP
jgi:hypothetical protein